MGTSGWSNGNDASNFLEQDNMLHQSTGYLLEKNERFVALCLSRALWRGDSYGEILKIPRKAVCKIRYLK